MTSSPAAFEGEAAERFQTYGDQVRGRLRYEVEHLDLEKYVSGKPKKIADIGAGKGQDSTWLAGLGHDVMLVEPSKDAIKQARQHYREADIRGPGQVTFVEGSLMFLLNRRMTEQFDMVLSHGVAMYQPNPQQFISQLVSLLKPGGILSLMEKSYDGAFDRLTKTDDHEALRLLEAEHTVEQNNIGLPTHAFTPGELNRTLRRAGVDMIEWSGVRVLYDDMAEPASNLPPGQLDLLVQKEYEAGHDPDLRAHGQMLHFIAQKPIG